MLGTSFLNIADSLAVKSFPVVHKGNWVSWFLAINKYSIPM
jgi:hypothetical protein